MAAGLDERLDRGRYQSADGTAEPGDLADECGADMRVLAGGRQEDRVDGGVQVPVRARELELVTQVRAVPHAADDGDRAPPPRVLDEQAIERIHLDARQIRRDRAQHLRAL